MAGSKLKKSKSLTPKSSNPVVSATGTGPATVATNTVATNTAATAVSGGAKSLAPLILLGAGATGLIIAGIVSFLPKNDPDAGGGSKTSSAPVVPKTCPFKYRGAEIELCKTVAELEVSPYTWFHRYNRFQIHDDNGSVGLIHPDETDQTLQIAQTNRLILLGSNGNYIIKRDSGNTQRQMCAYQANAAAKTYPPKKEPSDSDVDVAQPLTPVFFDLNDDGSLKATISKDKIITEWKIYEDPFDSGYFFIEVPDSATTGASVKNFVGGRLRMIYAPTNGYTASSTYTSNLNIRYQKVIVSSPPGQPAYSTQDLSGDNMDHFAFGPTDKFLTKQ